MLNIERVLKEKNMTQADLAGKLKVTPQAVNAVVCGRIPVSDKLLKRYADALDVGIEDLYDDFLEP